MKPWVVALAALTCLVWTSSQLQGQTAESRLAALEKLPNQERQQRLLEGAKSEGEAVIYANMDVAAMKPLTDGFMKRYPGLKATSVHFSGAAIITRIDSESRAGKPLSDVVLSGQLGVLALIEKKVAARYRSPEREFYRDGFKDKDGLWTAYMTNVMVSAYNTAPGQKRRGSARRRRSLEAALEGQTDDGQPVLRLVRHHAPVSRRRSGLRFMKRLNEQNISHQRGRRLMTQLVAAGEFDMAVETNLNSVLSLSRQGAPLAFAPIQPYFSESEPGLHERQRAPPLYRRAVSSIICSPKKGKKSS